MAKLWSVLFLCSMGFGADILSLGIRTEFRYADIDHQCYLPPLAENFTLAAEIDGHQITRATLRKNMLSDYSQIIELSSEEIAELTPLAKGSQWQLSQWKLSGRVLEMIFLGGKDQGLDTCFPPEPLATVSPQTFDFVFSSADSNKAVFTGETKSGKAYRIELSLTQDI